MTQVQTENARIRRYGSWILLALAIVIATGSFFIGFSRNAAVDRAERQAEQQVTDLRQELRDLQSTAVSTQEDVTVEATGMSPARKASDDSTMSEIMREALGWTNGDTYISSRQSLIDRWNLDESSQFLTVFMPGEEAGAWRTDSSGTTYFAYEGVNSQMDSFTSSVTDVNGTTYSYFAVVGMRTTSNDGKTSTVSYAAMAYDMDADGTVSNLMGWAGAPGLMTTY